MTRSKNSFRKGNQTRPSPLLKVEDRQLTALKQIQDNTAMNTYGAVPYVPDVPRLRLKRGKVYTFSRSTSMVVVSATSPTSVGYGLQFTLADLPNAAEFTSLFDQYRIVQVALTYFPSVPNTGSIYTAIDYDDASTPTFAEISQKETLQVNQTNQSFTRVLNPAVDTQLYISVGTAYAVQTGLWIDSVNASIPYYGLKVFLPAPNTGTVTGTFKIDFVIQGRSPS